MCSCRTPLRSAGARSNSARATGLTGLYPLDNEIDPAAADASLQIFRGNEAMMNEADAIIANLTPFRGRARMPARSMNWVTWRRAENCASDTPTIPSLYAERVARFTERETQRRTADRRAGVDRRKFRPRRQSDDDPRARSAWLPAGRAATAPADIWHDLTSFEACVRLAAERSPLCIELILPKRDSPPAPQARGHAAGRARPVRKPRPRAGRDRGGPRHRQ